MQLTKKDFIQKLYEIEEEQGLKLGNEVQRVVKSEIIPMDIITLINKYDKKYLEIYNAYNTIYLSRNKNPLYRNLRNKDLKISEVAVAMSSLITKILISCTKIQDEDEKQLFATAMNVDKINNALTNYSMFGKEDELKECAKEVRELLQILYMEEV